MDNVIGDNHRPVFMMVPDNTPTLPENSLPTDKLYQAVG